MPATLPDDTQPRIRVACFGAGWVTTHRHIPALRAHGGFEVVALVDRDGDRAAAAARAAGVPRHAVGSSVSDLSHLDEIDAVTCGTAPFAHHSVVRSALEAGKHVITEKPFTMTLEEGEELVRLAQERGLILAVVHNFQFAPSALKVRDWIDSGRGGQLRAVWAMQLSNPARRLPVWFDELPLGLFYDESPHLIYVARWLAGGGELERVSATAHPSTLGHANTPAQVDVQMRSGALPVMLQMNFEAPLSEWHVAVLGDRGVAMLDLFRDIAVFTPNDRRHLARDVLRTSLASTGRHWLGYLRSGLGHVRGALLYGNDEVFRRFHDSIRSGVPPEGIGPDDAMSVLAIQHWIVDSSHPSPAA